MASLKTREHPTTRAVEDIPLPRRKRIKMNQLFDIEVIDEDTENDRVKIHYVGYSTKYD